MERHQGAAGAAVGAPVHAVGGHDTASAFVAAPLAGPGAAVLSSGTWSLLASSCRHPSSDPMPPPTTSPTSLASTAACGCCATSWASGSCRSAAAPGRRLGQARDYAELQDLARGARADVPLFDPDDESLLLHRGDMPALIAQLCIAGGQVAPQGPGELLRSILTSLACKYRLVLERLERVSGRHIEVIHVVGGGVRNELLCQLTADLTGRPVLAGPA